ncbi:hypothetical protein CVT24_012758 [Panaeolus cyanescens]|uniref:Uncharacterized protein n=1 Tax=Panaeolus cyanescens TaxID=181874 RepID=A0A409YJL0_9AGAR|nr:hypothetical protein CVT24_012758 [Panaeolus cyanescens]
MMPSFVRALKATMSILVIGLSLQLELRGVAAAPLSDVAARTIPAGSGANVNMIIRQELSPILEARQRFPAEMAVKAPNGIVQPYV